MSGRVEHIRFSEIESYMRINRITDEHEQARLIERIRFLDSMYCSYYNDPDRKKEKKTKNG